MNTIARILRKTEDILNDGYNKMQFRRYQISIGEGTKINGKIVVSCEKMNEKHITLPGIEIGRNCKINSGSKYNLIGGEPKTILRTIDRGHITIKDHAAMSNCVIVSMCKVVIGEYVMIGGDVRIFDTDFHSLKYEQRIIYPDYHIISKPVVIQKGAFIGTGSMILKGVTVGAYAVVAAGSVVSKDIPPQEVWGGVPCRYIRKIEQRE